MAGVQLAVSCEISVEKYGGVGGLFCGVIFFTHARVRFTYIVNSYIYILYTCVYIRSTGAKITQKIYIQTVVVCAFCVYNNNMWDNNHV